MQLPPAPSETRAEFIRQRKNILYLLLLHHSAHIVGPSRLAALYSNGGRVHWGTGWDPATWQSRGHEALQSPRQQPKTIAESQHCFAHPGSGLLCGPCQESMLASLIRLGVTIIILFGVYSKCKSYKPKTKLQNGQMENHRLKKMNEWHPLMGLSKNIIDLDQLLPLLREIPLRATLLTL